MAISGATLLFNIGRTNCGLFDFDDTRITGIVPSPSGAEAVVVYLHHYADASRNFVAAKLVKPPFPKIGNTTCPSSNILEIGYAGSTDDWRQQPVQKSSELTERNLTIRWYDKGVEFCPADSTDLVSFNAGRFDYDAKITLCRPTTGLR